MDFTVQRTTPEAGEPPSYVLYGERGNTLLMADQIESADPESRRQIRLARPSGRLVATIDLPQVAANVVDDSQRTDYAVIHEYAVYAIISVRRRPVAEATAQPPVYYLLEVEGETWLVLPDPEKSGCFAFYDEVPAGLHTYDTLTELDLPAGIGDICRNGDEWRVTVRLEPRRLLHTDLVVLALALLIDRAPAAS